MSDMQKLIERFDELVRKGGEQRFVVSGMTLHFEIKCAEQSEKLKVVASNRYGKKTLYFRVGKNFIFEDVFEVSIDSINVNDHRNLDLPFWLDLCKNQAISLKEVTPILTTLKDMS